MRLLPEKYLLRSNKNGEAQGNRSLRLSINTKTLLRAGYLSRLMPKRSQFLCRRLFLLQILLEERNTLLQAQAIGRINDVTSQPAIRPM